MHDVSCEWTLQCQASFEMLKDALITSSILKYPDPNNPYTLFTDANKYAWACVLTQEHEHEKDGKIFKINHPITFASDTSYLVRLVMGLAISANLGMNFLYSKEAN